MSNKMTLSEELTWRGQIKDRTFDDDSFLNTPQTFYLGADASSGSLTIGNLAVYMLALRLVSHGWKAVLLAGGATTRIGDPGGKEKERDLKTEEEVDANIEGVRAQVARIFNDIEFTAVNNFDWFKDINFLSFLRDAGKHYSISDLIQKDFIASRIGEGGSGISYAEFSYNLIQGYDFWHLYKNHNVVLQIGGSDQWGNMLSGVPLIRKKEGIEVHALSAPLVIDKTTGKKFGKSEAGAVWLDEDLTSVFDFYQFWLNVDDQSVGDYLKIYTLIQPDAFDVLMEEFNSDPKSRVAQKYLAFEVTKIVHGEENAQAAKEATEALFSNAPLTSKAFSLLKVQLPTSNESDIQEFMLSTELASSKSEARRFVKSGAVTVDGQKIDENFAFKQHNQIVKRGKNKFALYTK